MRLRLLVIALLFVATVERPLAAQTPNTSSAVTVTLKPAARAESVIAVRDVATIEGGEARARDLIAGLDLAEFAAAQSVLTVTRDQVGFRLIVGGLDPRSFRLVGEPRCTVRKEVDETSLVIKSRDRVKLVARIGSTQLTATGEALQDGRAGQSIRVRNLDSNRTVLGRVVAAGVVEVDY